MSLLEAHDRRPSIAAQIRDGRDCWPPGWIPFVIGQLGIVVREEGGFLRFVDVRVLCDVASTRLLPGQVKRQWNAKRRRKKRKLAFGRYKVA